VAATRGLTPLVGRDSEVTLLLERWEQAKAEQGQVVLLSGDAGIGKSRLVQVLKDHVAHEPHIRWECRSVEHYQNTALFPLTDLFQRLWQFETGETPDEKVGKLEQALSQYRLPLGETVPLLAPLLSLSLPEDRYPFLKLVSPQRQRQKTLETIVAILLELAEYHPVLFILEDLHWTDPTTLELLGLLVEQVPTTAIATLLTCRPHFQPAWHHRSYITEMTLNHLSQTQVEQIVTCVTDGKTLPHEVLVQIVAKTDGVPLFVEELTKAILESGHLHEVDGHYELLGSLSTFTIPATLQDSLMARLDRLVSAKGIAQLAAVIGRQFPYALLQAVSQVVPQRYNENWEDLLTPNWSTKEGSHPKRPTCSSTHSFGTLPLNPCSRAPGSSLISASCTCSHLSFLRRLKDSQNCWRITIPRQVSPSRQSPIGTKLVNEPASAQPIWKPSITCVKGCRCSRHSLRHLSVSNAK